MTDRHDGTRLARREVIVRGAVWAVAGLAVGCSGDDADGDDTDSGAAGSTTSSIPGGQGGDVVVRNVRVFDGERLLDADSVVVEAGAITVVGTGLDAPSGVEVHDGGGGVLLPGLIDAHVHTNDARQLTDSLRFGVCSVLDMFTLPELMTELHGQRDRVDASDMADLWSAGVLVTAPGGHGTQFGFEIPTLAPGDDADRFVADRAEEGSDYIKLVIEDGTQSGGNLPTLTPDQVEAVVTAAHDRDLLAVVHVTTWEAAAIAAAAGADLLAHVPGNPLPDPTLLDQVVAADLAVVATLAVRIAVACTDDNTRLLDDPAIAEHLTDEQQLALQGQSPTCYHGRLDNALTNTALLHDAGVPLLAGTDFPNRGTTPGASLLLETELLAQAGLTPPQALTAATALPADKFGLRDRGRITEGHRGDLILINGDPTTNITHLRHIQAIWKNGHPINRSH